MRVGIITYHGGINYGATLQTYALQRYISQLGFDCEVIDLHRYGFPSYVPSKRYVSFAPPQRKGLWQSIRSLLLRLHSSRTYSISEELLTKLQQFNAAIPCSRPYCCIDDLYSDVPQYDIYITGSDQVWNPYRMDCVEPYFLTFAPVGARCISYGASLGVSCIDEAVSAKYAEWLKRYAAISVREQTAQRLLQPLTNIQVERVLDPTFLLRQEDWLALANVPKCEAPYLLLFTLRFSRELLRFAIRLSRESGLRLLYLCQVQPPSRNDDYVAIDNAGFEDFIGYINGAEMVITDSYHGTLLALQTHCRNLYSYIGHSKRSSRIVDVYSLFSLSGHVLSRELSESYAELNARTLNREALSRRIEKEAQLSRDFLSGNLQ